MGLTIEPVSGIHVFGLPEILAIAHVAVPPTAETILFVGSLSCSYGAL